MANSNKAAVIKMLMGDPNSAFWAIITADKAGGTPEDISADRAQLYRMLDRKGFDYLLVDGYYDGYMEQAVFVIGMHSTDAISVALMFGQEFWLTNAGLHYRGADGWFHTAEYVHRHVVDGELTSTRYDKSVIHCEDGDLVFLCEV